MMNFSQWKPETLIWVTVLFHLQPAWMLLFLHLSVVQHPAVVAKMFSVGWLDLPIVRRFHLLARRENIKVLFLTGVILCSSEGETSNNFHASSEFISQGLVLLLVLMLTRQQKLATSRSDWEVLLSFFCMRMYWLSLWTLMAHPLHDPRFTKWNLWQMISLTSWAYSLFLPWEVPRRLRRLVEYFWKLCNVTTSGRLVFSSFCVNYIFLL